MPPKQQTIMCDHQTKKQWDSLKRGLSAALDRPVRDPELARLLIAIGKQHAEELRKLAPKKSQK